MLKLALPLALAIAGPALSQEHAPGMDHDAMAMDGPSGEMMAAMDAMMADMAGTEMTGQPDADFLLLMMTHHQSAIDMARVELEHGEVGPVRDLAQRIIDAQEIEIEEMRQMLVELNHANPAP